MIDVKLPIQIPEPLRPANDVQAVHPLVPYAQGGIDPRRERDRKGGPVSTARPPGGGGGRRGGG
ncbi:MAG: hypothetical protein JJT90_17910, partial [Ectothiorhodospiraceae bacterium]|nr:hypothetical protein [Ectothiorhodospiraceae bacterium]